MGESSEVEEGRGGPGEGFASVIEMEGLIDAFAEEPFEESTLSKEGEEGVEGEREVAETEAGRVVSDGKLSLPGLIGSERAMGDTKGGEGEGRSERSLPGPSLSV